MRIGPIVAALAALAVACSSRPAAPPPPLPKAAGAVPTAQVEAPGQAIADPPPWPSPEAAGLDPAAVRRLVEGARESDAAGLVIVKDGRVVVEERLGPDEPLNTASVTKSFTSLAVGMLLEEGRLRSLDQPVSDFYPEWKQGRKRRITIRHLLNHTSGLQNVPRAAVELGPAADLVQFALAAELDAEPGEHWAYNNKAVGLVSGIVEKVSGQRLDLYLRDRLFAPLGITDWRWMLDKAGHAVGFGGLQIRPRDLARVGEMMADGGEWRGRRIVSRAWIESSALTPSQRLQPENGLLWWLVGGKVEVGPIIDEEGLARLRKAGASPAFIEKAARLKGQTPQSEGEAVKLVQKVLGPEGVDLWVREVTGRGIQPRVRRLGPPTGFEAAGDLGAYLWVARDQRLVVACLHRPDWRMGSRAGIMEKLEFPGFTTLAGALLLTAPKAN